MGVGVGGGGGWGMKPSDGEARLNKKIRFRWSGRVSEKKGDW